MATGERQRRVIGGRYELAERLGEGGMGAVWAGRDLLVDREVAVKEAYVTERQPRFERVLREARAAARVNHPAVVTIHDVVMEAGHPWIVMERVHGESLATLLEREPVLPEREAARIALAVVEALAAAHARGVLHRDVKPGNVLLGTDGRVVLSDFGIASIEGEESLTRSGEFVGSLAYTSPERMGGRKPGPAADLWSLGVLLFQMVEGWSPFQRESVEGTVAAVLTTEAPAPRRAPLLGPVIAELLAREPEDRPTAARVAEVLRTAMAPPAATRADPAAGQPGEPRPGRRRVWPAAALTTALLALVPLGILLKGGDGAEGDGGAAKRSARPTATATSAAAKSPTPLPTAAEGYELVRTPEFTVEVPTGSLRHDKNAAGQYLYSTEDGCEVVIVPGRDATGAFPDDPLTYMRDHEPELDRYRDSNWATAAGIRAVEAGGHRGAEGQFTWSVEDGQEVHARNTALLVDGRYHVVLVRCPEARRDTVSRVHRHVVRTYAPDE